jgi:ATP-dependent 26S proteasome regulatory subunit
MDSPTNPQIKIPYSPNEHRNVPHTYAMYQHLQVYEQWIDGLLGPIENRVQFESSDVLYEEFFLSAFTGSIINAGKDHPDVVKVDIPAGSYTRMGLSATVKPTLDNVDVKWVPTWRDTPVAMWFVGCEYPVIYLHVDFVVGTSSYEMTKNLILVHRSEIQKVLDLIAKTFKRSTKTMEVIRGKNVKLPDDGYKWDRVVLHPETAVAVKDDFEIFLKSQEWFVENDIPFRRGYLFYGPPGNGKTSVIRVMACHPLVSAFTIDMGNKDVENSDITDLFAKAATRSPSLIVLEDIDRMFSKQAQEEERRKVTLQHLLNCLDGVTSPEGTIVAATANEPCDLDPALLKRPGRFDRVIEFKSPETEQRKEYFLRRKSLALTPKEFDDIVDETNGFTFAQLREAYIIGGQSAFSENYDPKATINAIRLRHGVQQIRDSAKNISKYNFRKTVGFGEATGAGFASVVTKIAGQEGQYEEDK